MHYNFIVNIVNQILNEEITALEGNSTLNSWAEKVYAFLGQIEIIGNYGEQSKKILLMEIQRR